MDETATSRAKLAAWATLAAVVALALPALVLSYLPMTDVPQHLAVASILEHHDDPTFGFAEHYAVDWTRAPYVVPYALVLAMGKLVGLAFAMQIVVCLSVLAYPLGIALLLRAAGKPVWLALLALPLAYNRAFFWGFVNFNLAIGLALVAFAFYVSPTKSWRRDLVQVAAALAAVFSHVYGLAMIVMLVIAYAVVGGHRVFRARPWTLAPLVVGIVAWLVSSRESAGYGGTIDPPLDERVHEFPDQVLGGYQDASEPLLLLLALVAWALQARVRGLTPLERVAYIAVAGNLLLYVVLPQATWTAKFLHFRHAFLACALLPVAAVARSALARALTIVVAVATIANAWGHLVLFDREARRFDAVLAAVPPRARIVSLVFEANGDIMKTSPYLHFAAYAQAERGGMISMTFPAFFWNLPVAMRTDAVIPKTPEGLEWNPHLFDEKRFGYFYDHALVRIPGTRVLGPSAQFPFELVVASPPWQLYRRVR